MRISTLFAILALEATAIKIELLGEYEELDKETSDAVDAAVACTEEHGASMTAWWNYLRKWDGPLSLEDGIEAWKTYGTHAPERMEDWRDAACVWIRVQGSELTWVPRSDEPSIRDNECVMSASEFVSGIVYATIGAFDCSDREIEEFSDRCSIQS